jgi:hypothetical protein
MVCELEGPGPILKSSKTEVAMGVTIGVPMGRATVEVAFESLERMVFFYLIAVENATSPGLQVAGASVSAKSLSPRKRFTPRSA